MKKENKKKEIDAAKVTFMLTSPEDDSNEFLGVDMRLFQLDDDGNPVFIDTVEELGENETEN